MIDPQETNRRITMRWTEAGSAFALGLGTNGNSR